jgi:hypothetical protein
MCIDWSLRAVPGTHYLLQNIQTDLTVHITCYLTGARTLSLELKRLTTTSILTEVQNEWGYASFVPHAFTVCKGTLLLLLLLQICSVDMAVIVMFKYCQTFLGSI